MFRRFSKAGGGDKPSSRGYQKVSSSYVEDSVAMYRLKEAVQSVNILLPAPITLEMAVLSVDGVKKLVKGQSLARMYAACMRNLECLAKHVPGTGNPGLDAVVETHRENSRRLADACIAAILHMYMSIGTADGTEAFVDHAIKLTAAMEMTMKDLSLAEKALGLRPLRRQADRPTTPPLPMQRGTVLTAAATEREGEQFEDDRIDGCQGAAGQAPKPAPRIKPCKPPCDLDESEKLSSACAWGVEATGEYFEDSVDSIMKLERGPWPDSRTTQRSTGQIENAASTEPPSGTKKVDKRPSQSPLPCDQIEVLYDSRCSASPTKTGAKPKVRPVKPKRKALEPVALSS
ncbi:tegument protein UL51 [Columbid alphaherpesvirus 1]|uniref:Tegument protein UL51 n=1 Tax=Columbid alphaherpesvirus 1 TaxID=93386 RepID=A0A1V0M8J3_9ALPH|nr:tegument protein UL51 [Columbid alphaherpesvirus 1]ARD71379.1 tegument protein UL51 [Columbid alphaherpesvirus 1]